jgi:DNA-binding response OmpR family regulator
VERRVRDERREAVWSVEGPRPSRHNQGKLADGFNVEEIGSGAVFRGVDSGNAGGQRCISERVCDLALLDLALPCAVGVEVLRNVRTRKPEQPLVFLTASANVEERARCLDAGADDLIPKPFAFAELAARIRAVLRRGANAMSARLQVDDLVMDRLGHSVQRSDTMTNVVDVYINYLRRKVDSGYDRQLIRTVRGTGYQIGTNGYVS